MCDSVPAWVCLSCKDRSGSVSNPACSRGCQGGTEILSKRKYKKTAGALGSDVRIHGLCCWFKSLFKTFYLTTSDTCARKSRWESLLDQIYQLLSAVAWDENLSFNGYMHKEGNIFALPMVLEKLKQGMAQGNSQSPAVLKISSSKGFSASPISRWKREHSREPGYLGTSCGNYQGSKGKLTRLP